MAKEMTPVQASPKVQGDDMQSRDEVGQLGLRQQNNTAATAMPDLHRFKHCVCYSSAVACKGQMLIGAADDLATSQGAKSPGYTWRQCALYVHHA